MYNTLSKFDYILRLTGVCAFGKSRSWTETTNRGYFEGVTCLRLVQSQIYVTDNVKKVYIIYI